MHESWVLEEWVKPKETAKVVAEQPQADAQPDTARASDVQAALVQVRRPKAAEQAETWVGAQLGGAGGMGTGEVGGQSGCRVQVVTVVRLA